MPGASPVSPAPVPSTLQQQQGLAEVQAVSTHYASLGRLLARAQPAKQAQLLSLNSTLKTHMATAVSCLSLPAVSGGSTAAEWVNEHWLLLLAACAALCSGRAHAQLGPTQPPPGGPGRYSPACKDSPPRHLSTPYLSPLLLLPQTTCRKATWKKLR